MCLWASKEATQWLLFDLTKNKVRRITATKMYRFRVEKNGKIVLQAPFMGDNVLNFGKIISNRKTKELDYAHGRFVAIDKGIHCHGAKNNVHFSTIEIDCHDVIFIPVSIETKDIIGITDQFELGKSGEIAAMKIHITRKTWRKVKKVLSPKKE